MASLEGDSELKSPKNSFLRSSVPQQVIGTHKTSGKSVTFNRTNRGGSGSFGSVYVYSGKQDGKTVLEAYLKNDFDFPLENILVASKGYGIREGRQAVTAPLRRFFEKLEPGEIDFIETIPDKPQLPVPALNLVGSLNI